VVAAAACIFFCPFFHVHAGVGGLTTSYKYLELYQEILLASANCPYVKVSIYKPFFYDYALLAAQLTFMLLYLNTIPTPSTSSDANGYANVLVSQCPFFLRRSTSTTCFATLSLLSWPFSYYCSSLPSSF
jgi:hypothetical protein